MAGQRGQRGQMPEGHGDPEKIGLPVRPFLYTLDQISVLLNVGLPKLKAQYIYYEGRSTGLRHRGLLAARNIAPDDETPEWRVAERELIRWFRYKGFKYYERGNVGY